ncbi:hypothetical protein WB388_08885 [Streptomyces brasiliscabiei]|uniref:Secreted protein n=1 Tax=Streptomyces brasiliscabiei TaxID=2736302 RepID=A0ABU8GCF1_9ACTN
MTKRDVLIVSALGALWTVVILLAVAIAAAAIYRAISRTHTTLAARRERRTALRNGRRRLKTFTTIDDLKE